MDKLDELDEKEIARLCAERGCRYDIHTVAETGSTNDELKALAANGTADGYALIAGSQTAGRGRSGHSFFSPGSGVYLSVLLRPNTPPEETLHLTAAAGCAVCRAVEALTDLKAQIKWVNDVYIGGKKVCGILTESSILGNKTAWAVVGIGVNITEPQGGFPAEIKDRAAALFPSDGVLPPLFRERFAAELLCTFEKQTALSWENTLDEYRRRSYLTGKRICLSDGRSATAVGISANGGLVAELSDGGKIVIESQFSVKEIDQQ